MAGRGAGDEVVEETSSRGVRQGDRRVSVQGQQVEGDEHDRAVNKVGRVRATEVQALKNVPELGPAVVEDDQLAVENGATPECSPHVVDLRELDGDIAPGG